MSTADPKSNPETSNSKSQVPTKGAGMAIGFHAMLAVVIMAIVAGTGFGIVRMQRGLDALYAANKGEEALAGAAAPAPMAIVGDLAHGKALFNMSCFVCHGPTGAGTPGLGADLRKSKFIRTHTDKELITFIKMGRNPGDPNSVMNGTMPPKGGNPTLDDAGIQDLVGFIRSLQSGVVAGAPAPAAAPTGSSSSSTLP